MTDTLRVPDADLHYELRGEGRLIVLVGAPMDARAFEPLAELLAVDHTVLTTDPRGINRSRVDAPECDATPRMRADDLARLITHVGTGPAIVFGSSGGAVSALALAQARPDLVHTVIAHEPPVNEMLDDRDELLAKTRDLVATHASGDHLGAWRKFLAMANIQMPDEVVEQMFGGERSPQDLADERFQYQHMLLPTIMFRPDVKALKASRVLVGIGEESGGQQCERTSLALAAALGIEPTMFPGGHIGFAEDPATFEVRLREVLG